MHLVGCFIQCLSRCTVTWTLSYAGCSYLDVTDMIYCRVCDGCFWLYQWSFGSLYKWWGVLDSLAYSYSSQVALFVCCCRSVIVKLENASKWKGAAWSKKRVGEILNFTLCLECISKLYQPYQTRSCNI